VIHDGMLYDLIEGQGQDPMSKSCKKWPIWKPVSSADVHVIKILTVTARQYLNLTRH